MHAIAHSLKSPPFVALLSLLALGPAAPAQTDPAHEFQTWAPTPPMGWNSWDCYGSSVTEAEVRANAAYIADHLLEFGWEYVVVDIRWYIANPGDHHYNTTDPVVHLDAHGRLLPAPNRFPSARGENGENLGFKPLADDLHAMGLKFGVHMMRGIKQEAWEADDPIAGSGFSTRDIERSRWESGRIDNGASWLHDSFGMKKTAAAQAYYDALFALYAEWGVDYVKVDDMLRDFSRPDESYHADEIEMIRAAIDKSGRPMVLSLSPGAAPLERADHTARHANMWRVTNDLWDDWPLVVELFEKSHDWTPFRERGRWPDNDMLPLGRLGIRAHVGRDRMSNLTRDEQRSLMTLWLIARSPLMFGGDLPSNDAFTLSLLTNPEALAVNQTSRNNRQLFREEGTVAWTADAPGGGTYLAVFNLNDPSGSLERLIARAEERSDLITRSTPGRSVPIDANIADADRFFLIVDAGDGAGPDPGRSDYDWANWVDMRLSGPGVPTIPLTDLAWTSATSGWAGPTVGQNCEGNGPLRIDGKVHTDGIGTHAPSIIEYERPEGYTRLTGRAGLDDRGADQPNATTSVRFAVSAGQAEENRTVRVDLRTLGFEGEAHIRDLWSREDLGMFSGVFSTQLAPHASALYLIDG